MSDKLLLYIHGFNSSPKSLKAQMVAEYMDVQHPEVDFYCPQLPHYPAECMDVLEDIIIQNPGRELCFIGSSLGGYMSTYLANKYGGRSVLVNPAVAPYDLFKDYLGKQLNPYTRTRYELKIEHLRELIALDTASAEHPDNVWVLLQTGDEVLDFRLAQEKYRGCKLTIEQGGDHSFQGFERHLFDIVKFLKIA
jgi:predicted esterase YcpF (UPF0227 family)